ncbi:DUF2723 domain-containing protein [Rasiella rasia]|uniref:DUF2723 domain-containing protein n=1 Tax=Rasiella rasia TaxID=2744027 RepID=A0A6G6GIH9_9FLAO|nr:DUF2723 domain-containing protein [Rasiella rasia]QIE58310.1 DUF2723 domain-containing protein [Rasiella rasia]
MIKRERITSLILFVFVFTVYAISASRSISFWDSPEFIGSNYNLQATHPPGAPFYTMLCSIVLQFFSASKAAFVSNLISGFFGALTVTYLFKITFHITTKIQSKKSDFEIAYLPYLTGLTSALTLAFSNSFWIASTETEVYTLSFALLAIMIYIMLKWEHSLNDIEGDRLLLLLALLFGISTGVHLILISTIIPLSLLFTHKKYGLTIKNTVLSLLFGCLLFFFIYLFIIQGIIQMANSLDIWLVNTLNTSMNTGILVMLAIITAFFGISLLYTYRKKKFNAHHIVLALLFFLVGVSSYLMPIQRSKANSQIANGIENSNRMLQYIKGDQFGISSIPLLNGYTYNAPLNNQKPFLNGDPILTFDSEKQKYITVDNGDFQNINYADEFSMFFPRLYEAKDENEYKLWTTIKGEPIDYSVNGEIKKIYKPTFKENFNFFIDYQVSWLNLRYLFWNFIGKQNNNQGLGYVKDGNWISGINSIDKARVGDYSKMPEYFRTDKSRNAYYFIPFIFGIIGLLSLVKHRQFFLTTLFIFLSFGLGITLYINPVPSSILVRERDYIFIGSFLIFSLWVGLSILLFYNTLKFLVSAKIRLIVVSILVLIGGPIQMLAKGWDDHQRSKDTFAYEFGKAYLDACPEQAILITNGDNMTFPLWYLQEVENYRTDVRVLNFDQLNLDTHIDRLKHTVGSSKPIQISLKKHFYINGVDKLIPLQKEIDRAAELPILFEFFQDSTTQINWNGRLRHYMPATKFSIPIDTFKMKKNGLTAEDLNAFYTAEVKWDYPKDFYGLNEIVLMNVITNNIHDRPICFAINGKSGHYLGLQDYLVHNGMVERLAPIQRKGDTLNPKIVNTNMMYPYIMNKLQFEGLNDDEKFIPYENRVYVQDILRRNYYFLAQALLEENKKEEAILVLDKCFSLFPNKTIAYKQYAYALGKLYYRAGLKTKGDNICATAMKNIWDELVWITSFDPPYPAINVSYAEKLKNMYIQMRQQFPGEISTLNVDDKGYKAFETKHNLWKQRNWPY